RHELRDGGGRDARAAGAPGGDLREAQAGALERAVAFARLLSSAILLPHHPWRGLECLASEGSLVRSRSLRCSASRSSLALPTARRPPDRERDCGSLGTTTRPTETTSARPWRPARTVRRRT